MARSQKTMLVLPQTEGVQAAAAIPMVLPNLKHSGFDHPLHQGICRPTQRFCSPNSAPTPKLSKKPKMQATGDTFPTDWSPPQVTFLTPRATGDVVPTDWSPPHVTFLTPRATGDMVPTDWSPPQVTFLTPRTIGDVVSTHWSPPHVTFLTPRATGDMVPTHWSPQHVTFLTPRATGDVVPTHWRPPHVTFLTPWAPKAGRGAPARRWVGAVEPEGPRRLACSVPVEPEQEPQDSGPMEDLASREEQLWRAAGPSQQAVAGTSTGLTSEGSGSYVNSLGYLLQEKREQALEQERGELLLQHPADHDSLDLHEEAVPLTPEHRTLVERFSMSLQVIPSVHPGEAVFLPRHHPLPCDLDCSHLEPRNHLERQFLSSPLAQQLSFLRSGLLSNLYLHQPGCPVPLLRWLFQLLTWPPEISSGAFVLLWDLSVDGLCRQSDGDVRMWCPSTQEVMEVVCSLGTRIPALCPQGPSPHGRRVLASEASPSWREQQDTRQETALDISLSYIYKFLTLCAQAQPETATDGDLLDQMELLCRAGLDVRLRLLPNADLQQLLLLLLQSIQEWPGKLQQLCRALSLVSDHHHNLLAVVQFFPDVTSRSRQLRRQLSLVVIARMLGQQEAALLWKEEAQLVVLSRLLRLMRPAALGQHLDSEASPPRQEQQPTASAKRDYKVCYLCHSLLTLAGVVVSCQDITPDQREELRLLCMQLDRHISTHIRESPQAMHRTTLKDLATQTHIRWQELLTHCRPQAQCFSPREDI
ncbi:protein FAM178B [Myotis myotis]|uniref:protein FAM178B n=1 Tax=Myotis myotis TaxID=51298 RepID=UPI001748B974|nr:protein FAM178B [Myotis myotis]